jgi:hypothetical protein
MDARYGEMEPESIEHWNDNKFHAYLRSPFSLLSEWSGVSWLQQAWSTIQLQFGYAPDITSQETIHDDVVGRPPRKRRRLSLTEETKIDGITTEINQDDAVTYEQPSTRSDVRAQELSAEDVASAPSIESASFWTSLVTSTLTSSTQPQEAPEQSSEDDSEVLELNPRRDYVLQVNLLDNGYFASLRAHFSYWRSKDFVCHLLKHMISHQPTTTTGEQ